MAKINGIIVVLGIALLVYSIIGTFVGNPMIFSYLRPIKPATGVMIANSLLILSVLGKLSKKA